MSQITINDYKHILEFYKQKIPYSNRLLKKQAEKILANKLCRCIKKLEHKYKDKSVGICTKTIINNKGFLREKFTCKKKQIIHLKKKNNTQKNKK
jgi:hypothetical protein